MEIDYIQLGLLIITFASVLSPILVSIIDNIFKIKIKNIDNYHIEKRKALNEFINSVIKCINTINLNDKEIEPNIEFLKSYYKASNNLLLYFPKIDSKKFEKLNDSVRTGRRSKILNDSESLIKELSKYVKKK